MNTDREGEDRRITKSRNKMKNAFIRLLSGKSMDQITVTQICIAANVTRITFYTYYPDKYALADEIFRDMAQVTDIRFRELQKENNGKNNLSQSYCNLFDSIIDIFYGEESLLPFAVQRENPNFYGTFSEYLVQSVENLDMQKHVEYRYPMQMTTHFLCDGLWGFICAGRKENLSVDEIRAAAKNLIDAVVKNISVHAG